MNALTVATPHLAYAEMERLAADMATSGLFGFKTKQEAMSIMMIAHAEGKHPATAARDYDVINKKLAKRAEAMMRDFMEGGGKVKWHALTDALADATFTHPQGGEVRISWDMERALQAGLSTKENWRKYPRQMLRNRTVSEGVRTVWPLATSGLYEPGEVAYFTGKTIEAEPDTRDTLNAEVPLKAVASATPRAPVKRAPVDASDAYQAPPEPPPTGRRTAGQLLDGIEIALRAATSRVEVDRILDVEEVFRLREHFADDTPAILRLNALRDAALERHPPLSHEDDGTEAHEPETEGVV